MLMNPRLWLVAALLLALSATHWKAYTMGGAAVTAERVAEDLQRSRAALRYIETKTAQVTTLEKAYADKKRQAASAAAGADAALDSLRNTLATTPDRCTTPTTSGDHGAAGLEQELLGQCAGALVALAKEADGLEGKVVALQGYVTKVCRTLEPWKP